MSKKQAENYLSLKRKITKKNGYFTMGVSFLFSTIGIVVLFVRDAILMAIIFGIVFLSFNVIIVHGPFSKQNEVRSVWVINDQSFQSPSGHGSDPILGGSGTNQPDSLPDVLHHANDLVHLWNVCSCQTSAMLHFRKPFEFLETTSFIAMVPLASGSITKIPFFQSTVFVIILSILLLILGCYAVADSAFSYQLWKAVEKPYWTQDMKKEL
ncbi:MAG: hypothetical protein MZU79_05930 [Anaerotruncus sp.]|nr:hypothetical protein [Anaerotruncus sp.]